jgi:hypothetical protein
MLTCFLYSTAVPSAALPFFSTVLITAIRTALTEILTFLFEILQQLFLFPLSVFFSAIITIHFRNQMYVNRGNGVGVCVVL